MNPEAVGVEVVEVTELPSIFLLIGEHG